MAKSTDLIKDASSELNKLFAELEDKRAILRAKPLRELYRLIAEQAPAERAAFGAAVNQLKAELLRRVEEWEAAAAEKALPPIDVTAPFDANLTPEQKPQPLETISGSIHPISAEINRINDIFIRMGFDVVQSLQLDDEYHMFDSLNFPKDHPSRDEYDTFVTEEGLVLPAHTSTMQNRILKQYTPPLAVVIPGRVFRNEDLDATHEHTFHQVEGVVVGEGITLGDMLGTLKTFLETYFEQAIEYKTQPFYFPFVEPGLEFLIRTPERLRGAITDDWVEIMGCGMIHPKVLKEGGVDPQKYSGFAWGGGVDRLVMLARGIEDVRHFMGGELDFLRQFKGGEL